MHMAQLCSVSDVSGPECLLPSDQRTLLPAVAAAAAAPLLLLLLCRCLARMRRSTTTCTHTDTQQGQPLGWLHRPARSLPATARLEDARTESDSPECHRLCSRSPAAGTRFGVQQRRQQPPCPADMCCCAISSNTA